MTGQFKQLKYSYQTLEQVKQFILSHLDIIIIIADYSTITCTYNNVI